MKVTVSKLGFRGIGTYAVVVDMKDTGSRVEIKEISDIEDIDGDIMKVER